MTNSVRSPPAEGSRTHSARRLLRRTGRPAPLDHVGCRSSFRRGTMPNRGFCSGSRRSRRMPTVLGSDPSTDSSMDAGIPFSVRAISRRSSTSMKSLRTFSSCVASRAYRCKPTWRPCCALPRSADGVPGPSSAGPGARACSIRPRSRLIASFFWSTQPHAAAASAAGASAAPPTAAMPAPAPAARMMPPSALSSRWTVFGSYLSRIFSAPENVRAGFLRKSAPGPYRRMTGSDYGKSEIGEFGRDRGAQVVDPLGRGVAGRHDDRRVEAQFRVRGHVRRRTRRRRRAGGCQRPSSRSSS